MFTNTIKLPELLNLLQKYLIFCLDEKMDTTTTTPTVNKRKFKANKILNYSMIQVII